MSSEFRRQAPICLLVFLAACVEHAPVVPSANELVVQAVLDAGASDQYVVVQTTTGALASATAVSGAQVSLELPDGRTILASEERDTTRLVTRYFEQPLSSVYHFPLRSLGTTVQPGGAYRLRVTTRDGRVVTGRTVVPSAVAVSLAAPRDSFGLRLDTLLMRWPRVPGARTYQVAVRPLSRTFALTFFADTSASLYGSMTSSDGRQLFVRGQEHEVVVLAVDDNYYDYYRRGTDSFTGVGVISHLDGAVGLFGSIVELKTLRLLAY